MRLRECECGRPILDPSAKWCDECARRIRQRAEDLKARILAGDYDPKPTDEQAPPKTD